MAFWVRDLALSPRVAAYFPIINGWATELNQYRPVVVFLGFAFIFYGLTHRIVYTFIPAGAVALFVWFLYMA